MNDKIKKHRITNDANNGREPVMVAIVIGLVLLAILGCMHFKY